MKSKQPELLIKFMLIFFFSILIFQILYVAKEHFTNCLNIEFNASYAPLNDEHINDAVFEISKLLNDTWIDLYRLNQSQPAKLNNFQKNSKFPAAPHLQNCPELLNEITKLEHFDSKIGHPKWSLDRNVNGVKPPWIKGDDVDNLPQTRLSQRNLWMHQHPLDCKSSKIKFAIVESNEIKQNQTSLLSTLPVLSSLFAISFVIDRVFVTVPSKLSRNAKSQTCDEESFDCYFFPIVSNECKEEAMDLYKGKERKTISYSINDEQSLHELIHIEERMIILNSNSFSWNMWNDLSSLFESLNFPKNKLVTPTHPIQSSQSTNHLENGQLSSQTWSDGVNPSWEESNLVNQSLDEGPMDAFAHDDKQMHFQTWMESQIVRYMLRWPNLHLCHVLNQERHKTYGKHVIYSLLSSSFEQKRMEVKSNLLALGGLDPTEWIGSGFPKPNWDEPYIMRPILSMHVHDEETEEKRGERKEERKEERKGDKEEEREGEGEGEREEMNPLSLSYHMQFAQMIHFFAPDLKNVWLFTEMESVIEESKAYQPWSFYRLNIQNIKNKSQRSNVSDDSLTFFSLVNVIISSECDYFLSTSESNLDRLIYLLRLTNGHVKSNYLLFDFN